jgi:hypothetical protein
MRTHVDDSVRQRSRRLADLQNQADELERQLTDARVTLDRERGHSGDDEDAIPAGRSRPAGFGGGPLPAADDGNDDDGVAGPGPTAGARTEVLVTHGRRGAYYRRLSRGQLIAIVAAALAALVIALVLIASGGGASWPASVATVQAEAAQACKNPDVASEPGQVNFACAPATRQVLWVFALMTSNDDPNFADAQTSRMGLEPITPAEGGDVAFSLNLHHPYSPTNPVDSLAVAARAINNIIGGATVIGANGSPVVQEGLEGTAADCVRYTGSGALTSRAGFPSLCAKPITTAAGQAALVSDVYQKWIVGAAPQFAEDAAVLFSNASNPGSPEAQAILLELRTQQPLG